MTEQTNTQPSSKPSKASLPESTLDWFKTNAIAELEMRFVPSVQVALRNHLRASYWVSKGKPLTPGAVDKVCKAISFADTPEGAVPVPVGRQHIDAVLCPDHGFAKVVQPDTGELLGWSIPDLKEQLERADKAYQDTAAARSARGKKGADARWDKTTPKDGSAPPPAGPPEQPPDPNNPDF